MKDQRGRRSFLAALSAMAAAMALKPREAFAERRESVVATGKWDLSWMDSLNGKHKQVFDIGGIEIALLVVTNNLDAYREVFDLGYPDVNCVVAISGAGFPINAGDALWAKYEFGRRYKIKEPGTDNWATRNIWLNGLPMRGKVVGVKLQERGAIFWQCNNALNGVTATLAGETKQAIDIVKAELVAGLNPGVHVVPAHTQALGLVQGRGCAYQFIRGVKGDYNIITSMTRVAVNSDRVTASRQSTVNSQQRADRCARGFSRAVIRFLLTVDCRLSTGSHFITVY